MAWSEGWTDFIMEGEGEGTYVMNTGILRACTTSENWVSELLIENKKSVLKK